MRAFAVDQNQGEMTAQLNNDATRRVARFKRLRIIIAILLPVVFAISWLWLSGNFHRGAIVMVSPLTDPDPSTVPLSGPRSLIPVPLRKPLNYLRYYCTRAFGAPRQVNIEATLIECRASQAAAAAILDLGKPEFSAADGMKVWILAWPEMQQVTQRCDRLPGFDHRASPRMTTASGIRTSISSYSTGAGGLILESLAHVRGDSIDLAMSVFCSESVTNQIASPPRTTGTTQVEIVTNLAFQARLWLTNRTSALFLTGKTRHADRATLLLISADSPKPK